MLYRTRFGLRLRAVGENPGAVDTAGVSVVRLRYAAVLIAGLLCGLAGAYLATGHGGGLRPRHDGRQGLHRARGADLRQVAPVAGALGLPALRLPRGVRHPLPGRSPLPASAVPVQFMQALPYILTVIMLAGFVGKAIPPRAGGRPYVKER